MTTTTHTRIDSRAAAIAEPAISPQARRHSPRRYVRALIGAVSVTSTVIAALQIADAKPAAPLDHPATTATVSDSALPTAAFKLPPLLAADVVAKVFGTVGMTADAPYTTMRDGRDGDCAAVFIPANRHSYDGSGFVAVRGQSMKDLIGDYTFNQAVAAFHDSREAAAYADARRDEWDRCSGRRIDAQRAGDGPVKRGWQLGKAYDFIGMIALPRTLDGGSHWVCHRGLEARNNLVFDVMACGNSVVDSTFKELAGRLADQTNADR